MQGKRITLTQSARNPFIFSPGTRAHVLRFALFQRVAVRLPDCHPSFRPRTPAPLRPARDAGSSHRHCSLLHDDRFLRYRRREEAPVRYRRWESRKWRRELQALLAPTKCQNLVSKRANTGTVYRLLSYDPPMWCHTDSVQQRNVLTCLGTNILIQYC